MAAGLDDDEVEADGVCERGLGEDEADEDAEAVLDESGSIASEDRRERKKATFLLSGCE